jgi:hypothetical protein
MRSFKEAFGCLGVGRPGFGPADPPRRLLSFMSFLSYCEPALTRLEGRADTERCIPREGRQRGGPRLRLGCVSCRVLPQSAMT